MTAPQGEYARIHGRVGVIERIALQKLPPFSEARRKAFNGAARALSNLPALFGAYKEEAQKKNDVRPEETEVIDKALWAVAWEPVWEAAWHWASGILNCLDDSGHWDLCFDTCLELMLDGDVITARHQASLALASFLQVIRRRLDLARLICVRHDVASEVATNVCEFLGFGYSDESDVIVAEIRGELYINGSKAFAEIKPSISVLREEAEAIKQEPESDSRRAKASNLKARLLELQSQSEATSRALKSGYYLRTS